MGRRNSIRAVLALLVTAASVCAVLPYAATATHPRPKGATPMDVSLVPFFESCSAPNRMHGPPLAHPSCGPPRYGSPTLWTGTPDGVGSDFYGNLRFRAVTGGAGAEDLGWAVDIYGVRCAAGFFPCALGPDMETTDGGAYHGELGVVLTLKLTDHFSGPGRDEAATLGHQVQFEVHCTGPDGGIGATCRLAGSLEALVPGAVPPQTRALYEFERININDGGGDADPSTADDNFPLLRQGVFVP